MRVDVLDYELPPELIAQHPAEHRELARLMRLTSAAGAPEHLRIADLPELVPPGALVVVNDTRVIRARLLGRKRDTGGRVELLLARHLGTGSIEVSPGLVKEVQLWRALGKASKPLRSGAEVEVGRRGTEDSSAALVVRSLGRAEDDGLLEVAVWTPSGEPVEDALPPSGHIPLPPSIRRDDA